MSTTCPYIKGLYSTQAVREGRLEYLFVAPGSLGMVRVRVTELKYVVLELVYQIIGAPGWSLRV